MIFLPNGLMGAEHLLFAILANQIRNGQLRLPSLPEVALRVRDVADNPDSTLLQIADVVARDPALSLRLIRLANTAHYARAARVTTVHGATHRIGMRAIRNIAIAMALEQLFLVQNPVVRHYMEQAWQRAITACAAATALFNHSPNKGALHVESVTLLALTHNIGLLPILAEAERHDDIFANPTFLERAFNSHGGEIAAAILEHWQFEGDMIDASRNWRNARRFSRPAGSGCKPTGNRCRSSTVTGHVARPVCWRRYRHCCRARHLPAPPSVNPALHTRPPQPPIQSTCDQHAVTC